MFLRIFRHPHVAALWCCIALQAAVTLSYSITLNYTFKTSGFDGMVYEQLMWNFIDGKGLTSSIAPPYIPQHWLGFHFSPILYLLIPFYYLFPHIETLLAIGSVCVALAAWPIFVTAKHIFEDTFQALMIALLYLISPFVMNGMIWDFHEVDFAPLCIASMLWAVVTKNRNVLLALSIVLMCIKEHYGLSVAGFGLLWAWKWKEPKFGLGLAILGIAILYFIFAVVIPHFNPTGNPIMMNPSSPEDRFGWMMSGAGIKLHFVSAVVEAFWYGAKLLLPFLLLPLGAFMWLLPAIADVATNSLSSQMFMRSVFSYHSMALMPVILIALCQSIRKYFPRRRTNDIVFAVVVASVCFSYTQLALPFSEMGNVWELSAPQFDYTPEDRKTIDEINQLIAKDAPVAAQTNILSHLTPHFEMYPYPLSIGNANSIVLHFGFPFKRALSIFGVPYSVPNEFYFSSVDSLLQNPDWGVVYYSNRWVVLQKNTADALGKRQEALEGFAKLREDYTQVQNVMRNARP